MCIVPKAFAARTLAEVAVAVVPRLEAILLKWVFTENRFSETIFKRKGLLDDLYSYKAWESPCEG